jgi:hypothetical protein
MSVNTLIAPTCSRRRSGPRHPDRRSRRERSREYGHFCVSQTGELSQANVRRGAGFSIEQIAADIAHRGLLSPNVRPITGEVGKETGMFKVPAGGRAVFVSSVLAEAVSFIR